MKINKEIKLISEVEHVLKKPQIWVSSAIETDEDVYYINEDGIICSRTSSMNIGMYKLFWELFDNAIDEIKRVKSLSKAKRKKKHIVEITLHKDTNSISVRDNGDGFFQAIKRNPVSKVSNIETAYCYMRSSSNFENDGIKESLIGTYGVGASLVNMLSDHFHVLSTNRYSRFEQKWYQFKADKRPKIKKGTFVNTGTKVTFQPRSDIFGKSRFCEEIMRSQLALRKKCLMLAPENLEIVFYVVTDGVQELIHIPSEIFHEDSYVVEMENFYLAVVPKHKNSSDILFINSTQCQTNGSPIRYMIDVINDEIYKNDKINNYYNVQLFMNLPPNLVMFGDQNKTKYSIPKNRIAPYIKEILLDRKAKFVYRFPNSMTYQKILEESQKLEENKGKKQIEKEKHKFNHKISKKYLPASKKKEFLFIVEGESAQGSISQGRNPLFHGIYSLQGKIQNCSRVAHLRTNSEIMELISILDLKFDKDVAKYKNIVIAADGDPDGWHIVSLIINFFQKWFPKIITHGKLSYLKIPLMSYGTGKNIKYLYDIEEINKYKGNQSNKRYLKGLGALSPEDWQNIMSNMHLVSIKATKLSNLYLDATLGDDSDKKKMWLNGIDIKEIYDI